MPRLATYTDRDLVRVLGHDASSRDGKGNIKIYTNGDVDILGDLETAGYVQAGVGHAAGFKLGSATVIDEDGGFHLFYDSLGNDRMELGSDGVTYFAADTFSFSSSGYAAELADLDGDGLRILSGYVSAANGLTKGFRFDGIGFAVEDAAKIRTIEDFTGNARINFDKGDSATTTNYYADGHHFFSKNNTGIGNLSINGFDIAGALVAFDYIRSTSTTQSTNSLTGALRIAGGAGIEKNLNVGESVSTGAPVTINSVGLGAISPLIVNIDNNGSFELNRVGVINPGSAKFNIASFGTLGIQADNTISLSPFNASVALTTFGSTGIATTFASNNGGISLERTGSNPGIVGLSVISFGVAQLTASADIDLVTGIGGRVHVNSSTASTNSTTGAVVVDGGVGIGLDLQVGGSIAAPSIFATSFIGRYHQASDSASGAYLEFIPGNITRLVNRGGASLVAFTIHGELGQTANLQEWNINGAAAVASISKDGNISIGANKVVGARDTGWTAMTGSPDKATSYATGSVTLAQLAGRVAQLQASLTTHGLIGA